MSVAPDIAEARALFEKAERETNPALKAQALEEVIVLLDSCDPDDITEAQAQLIANVRLANARRLLVQLVGMSSVSMDAWLDYVRLLVEELRPEVGRLIEADAALKKNYERFIGPEFAQALQKRDPDE